MNNKRRFVRLGLFLEAYWSDLCYSFGTIALAILGIVPNFQRIQQIWTTKLGLFLLSAITLSVVGIIFQIKKSSNIIKLNQKYNKLRKKFAQIYKQLQKAKEGYSQTLYYHILTSYELLNLGNSERISVYKHDNQAYAFNLLCRYSKNPDYKKKGRAIYPDDQGCIGKAFRDGEHTRDGLPSFSSKAYSKIMQDDYNISEAEKEELTMPTRTFAAFCIKDIYNDKTLGVIVFESTEKEGLDQVKIKEMMTGSESKRLAYLLIKIKDKEPTLSLATSEGY